MLVPGAAPPPRPLENAANPADRSPVAIEADCDQVHPVRPGPKQVGGSAQAPPLLRGELIRRILADPGLHLDRHHQTVDLHDEIDLAPPHGDVASDEVSPPPEEEGERNRFAGLP